MIEFQKIYKVTGLRSNPWLFEGTRYMKLALNRRAKRGGAKHVKIERLDYTWAHVWHDVTYEFLDENGRAKW